MRLDDMLPKYDFSEVHTISVKANLHVAYKATMEVTMGEISGIVRILFLLSSLPDKLKKTHERTLVFNSKGPLLPQMLQNGFILLDEKVGSEIIFGLVVPGSIGNILKKSSSHDKIPVNCQEFLSFKNPAYLWVVANFLVTNSDTSGIVIISTESRTMALSEKSRTSFRLYWWVIRPWSGLIRRFMLKAIKRRAEQN
jgi:hypothetical protein